MHAQFLVFLGVLLVACSAHERSVKAFQSLRTGLRIRGGADRRKGSLNKRPFPSSPPPRYGPGGGSREEDEYRYGSTYGSGDEDYTGDTVVSYTQTSSGKALVALAAALSAGIVVHLIQSLLLAHTFKSVVYVSMALGAVFVFLKGDQADFARALGVFTILLVRRASPQYFLPRAVTQLKSFLQVSHRRPFPPDKDEEPDISYSIIQGTLAVAFLGGFLGWNLVKPIPLFPSWLGGLLAAAVFAYGSSFSDATGDLLRFSGYTVTTTLGSLSATANEVALREKTAVILGQTLFFLNDLDKQFEIRKKLRYLLGELVAKGTMMFYRSRMGGDNDNSYDTYNNNSNRGRSSGVPRGRPARSSDGNGYYEDGQAGYGEYAEYGEPYGEGTGGGGGRYGGSSNSSSGKRRR